MTAIEETEAAGGAAELAARTTRALDVTARCVRAECAALLREAERAADGTGKPGEIFDLAILGATLAALGAYVRDGADPAVYLARSATRGRHGVAERILARLAVETERERLGEARGAFRAAR